MSEGVCYSRRWVGTKVNTMHPSQKLRESYVQIPVVMSGSLRTYKTSDAGCKLLKSLTNNGV